MPHRRDRRGAQKEHSYILRDLVLTCIVFYLMGQTRQTQWNDEATGEQIPRDSERGDG